MHKLFDGLLAPGFNNELCWIGMLPLKVLIHWTRDSVGTKAGNRGAPAYDKASVHLMPPSLQSARVQIERNVSRTKHVSMIHKIWCQFCQLSREIKRSNHVKGETHAIPKI